jgi:hypothetical protein
VLETFESLRPRDERSWFSRYATAVLLVAEADLGLVEARGGREATAETLVIGTVSCDAHFPASQFLAGSYESLRIRS